MKNKDLDDLHLEIKVANKETAEKKSRGILSY